MISITVNSPEKSCIEYPLMACPLYQYVISLFVNLPIRRGPGVLVNVSVLKHRALNK